MTKGLTGGTIPLLYGKKEITFNFSKLEVRDILLPFYPAPLDDIVKRIKYSLLFPISSLSFRLHFSPGDKVLILVSDITRNSGLDIFLPILIEELNSCGIPDKNIEILFTLGIHRALKEEEQLAILGKDIGSRIKAYNHNAWSDETVSPGITSRGNQIFLNRKIFEADKVVLTGTINFHYLAGFGGGRKSLLPGAAQYDSIIKFHLLSLYPEPGKGRHPKASAGILTDNPMHEEMEEVLDMVKPCFLLNTVMDSSKQIVEVFAGDPKEAFMKGCIYFLDHYAVRISGKTDIVIASCGGLPYDINFIQAHKSLEYSKNALKKGGVLVLLAQCSDGIGNNTFLNWFEHKNVEEFELALRKSFEVNGQTAYSTLMKAKEYKIILVSSLPKEVVEKMSITPATSIEEAMDIAFSITGSSCSAYVIPQAAKVLPYMVDR
ncbi:MAG: hypothetical protein A2149_02695 [Candidatus Schekmanbacteria bacterium RBG_16_38_11]|uniref:Uncharacterized protein n=1 Tax=Candidatus Schekmanbacteria bacterium RBG_16_38_11 TaxID=1817880 RepID=A0A1F7RSC9_9BACT|nr:MAG: hypothetical protein A2149_02695 [Candidatus Schekmanbacteria bacterium RBG_16_38_11]